MRKNENARNFCVLYSSSPAFYRPELNPSSLLPVAETKNIPKSIPNYDLGLRFLVQLVAIRREYNIKTVVLFIEMKLL